MFASQSVRAFVEKTDHEYDDVKLKDVSGGPVLDGQKLRLKIDSFPTRIFYGEIEIVGEQVMEKDRKRYLTARARLEGNGLGLKTGMLGRAKILVGPRSLGYVLFRKPVRWLRRMVWILLP